MKKILLTLFLTFCIFLVAQPSYAADLADGAKLFKANCIGCHLGGNNSVVKAKTLKVEALDQYGMHSLEAVITQVTKGKNGMPAFGKKLKADQIENVASYVIAQAENGWKKK